MKTLLIYSLCIVSLIDIFSLYDLLLVYPLLALGR